MEKSFTERESLQIIQEMVQSTRGSLRSSANIYLLWGWLVMISASLHYVLMMFTDFKSPFLVWPILMTLGGIITPFLSFKKDKKEDSPSYASRMMGITYTAFLGPLILALSIGFAGGWEYAYPIFMMMYGCSSVIAGGILRFKALISGGIASMIIALIALFVPFKIQLLLIILAIGVSYLIPGYLLKRAN